MTPVRLLAIATLTAAGVLTATAPAFAASQASSPLGAGASGAAANPMGGLPVLSSLPLPLVGNSNSAGNGLDGLGGL